MLSETKEFQGLSTAIRKRAVLAPDKYGSIHIALATLNSHSALSLQTGRQVITSKDLFYGGQSNPSN
jgi:hypothetical protein